MMKHLLFYSLLAVTLHADDAQPKTAEEILRIVRNSYASQNQKADGQLRDDATGRVEPLELTMDQQVMRFRFKNPPAEIIHLDMNTSPATLYQMRPGGSGKVPAGQLGTSVRGMDFNYEDLSLRFLYWPRPQMIGVDRVAKVKCWIIRVTNPGKEGPYHVVDIWVHQGSGGAVQMKAWDYNSKVIKRYLVDRIQKVGKATLLKELKVETLDPSTGKVKGRTYMKLENPEKK